MVNNSVYAYEFKSFIVGCNIYPWDVKIASVPQVLWVNIKKYIHKKINNAPVPHPAMRVVASRRQSHALTPFDFFCKKKTRRERYGELLFNISTPVNRNR